MQLDFEKDDAKITIGGSTFCCTVNASVEVTNTKGQHGCMRSGSSSYEDLVEPPSGGEVEIESATLTIFIYDNSGNDIGKLELNGEEWFYNWFDEICESEVLI